MNNWTGLSLQVNSSACEVKTAGRAAVPQPWYMEEL